MLHNLFRKNIFLLIVITYFLSLSFPHVIYGEKIGPISPFEEIVNTQGDKEKNLVLGVNVVSENKVTSPGYKTFAKAYGLATYYSMNPSLNESAGFGLKTMYDTMKAADHIHFRLIGIAVESLDDKKIDGLISEQKNDISKRILFMLGSFFTHGAALRSGQFTNSEMFLIFCHTELIKKTTLYGADGQAITASDVFKKTGTSIIKLTKGIYTEMQKSLRKPYGSIPKPDTFK